MHPTRKLKKPQELLDLWNEYKDWRKSQGRPVPTLNPRTGEVIYVLHFPPLHIDSFKVWTVDHKGWGVGSIDNYIDNKDGYYDDFGGMVTHIKRSAKTDRFDGAAIGQYKEGLINRFDGYSERQQIEQKQVDKFDFDE